MWLQAALQAAEAQLASMAGALAQQQKLQEQLELARHALQLLETRVHSSASHQAQLVVTGLAQQLEEASAQAEAAMKLRTDSAALIVVRGFCVVLLPGRSVTCRSCCFS